MPKESSVATTATVWGLGFRQYLLDPVMACASIAG